MMLNILRQIFNHVHNPQSCPIGQLDHFLSTVLPIDTSPMHRHSGQRTPHLQPQKPSPPRSLLTMAHHHRSQPLPSPIRMREDCVNTRALGQRVSSCSFRPSAKSPSYRVLRKLHPPHATISSGFSCGVSTKCMPSSVSGVRTEDETDGAINFGLCVMIFLGCGWNVR